MYVYICVCRFINDHPSITLYTMPINILGTVVLWAILRNRARSHLQYFPHIKWWFFFSCLGRWILNCVRSAAFSIEPIAELDGDMIFMICMETFIYIFDSCWHKFRINVGMYSKNNFMKIKPKMMKLFISQYLLYLSVVFLFCYSWFKSVKPIFRTSGYGKVRK